MKDQEDFQLVGGEYHYTPCLNKRDDWMHVLTMGAK
jgi:hypothetical protein